MQRKILTLPRPIKARGPCFLAWLEELIAVYMCGDHGLVSADDVFEEKLSDEEAEKKPRKKKQKTKTG